MVQPRSTGLSWCSRTSSDWFVSPWVSALTFPFTAANAEVPDFYAPYAYDCANLIALAAQAAQSDDATKFIDQVVQTSRAGVDCRNFTECAKDLAEGRNIDLNGASGRIELQSNGDAGYGVYDVWVFGDDGKDQTVKTKTESLP